MNRSLGWVKSRGPLGPGHQHTQMFPSPQTEGHSYLPPLTIQSLPPAIITFHVRRENLQTENIKIRVNCKYWTSGFKLQALNYKEWQVKLINECLCTMQFWGIHVNYPVTGLKVPSFQVSRFLGVHHQLGRLNTAIGDVNEPTRAAMVESSKMFADLMSRCITGGTAWSKKQQLLH